jgi:hypothetical protein
VLLALLLPEGTSAGASNGSRRDALVADVFAIVAAAAAAAAVTMVAIVVGSRRGLAVPVCMSVWVRGYARMSR